MSFSDERLGQERVLRGPSVALTMARCWLNRGRGRNLKDLENVFLVHHFFPKYTLSVSH